MATSTNSTLIPSLHFFYSEIVDEIFMLQHFNLHESCMLYLVRVNTNGGPIILNYFLSNHKK